MLSPPTGSPSFCRTTAATPTTRVLIFSVSNGCCCTAPAPCARAPSTATSNDTAVHPLRRILTWPSTSAPAFLIGPRPSVYNPPAPDRPRTRRYAVNLSASARFRAWISTYTCSSDTAAGVTPGSRLACPSVIGRTRSNVPCISRLNPLTAR